MIELRPARASDADQLFEWRNDPQTLLNSTSTAIVTREAHNRWVEFNIAYGYPAHIVMMADNDLGSVGVIRFDEVRSDPMAYDVSLLVAPRHRGKGFGKAMLPQACAHMTDFTLNAVIRRENKPSQRCFEDAGFKYASGDGRFFKYRKEPS